MKLLIADKFEQVGLAALDALGLEVANEASLDAATLPAALTEASPDILIVRSTKVTAAAIAACPRLKLIIRAGAGVDTIDATAASRAGVFVANCPGKNAVAVAELAIGLMIACDRRIPDQVGDLRSGKWNKKEYSRAAGLYGRTLGLIGLGTIASEVAYRARALGMEIVVWSRNGTAARAAEIEATLVSSALDVARSCDIVSLHVAATPETKHLVNDEFIDAMRPGAILINTSRGSIVDEVALARGIGERDLRAGLDVFGDEPGAAKADYRSTLANLPGVFGTHHVGASTDQAQQAIALEACRIVEAFVKTGQVPNVVNRASTTEAACLMTIRHHNLPGVLATVFDVLGRARINVEEMENILYEGASAACARIQLSQAPTPEQLTSMKTQSSEIMSIEIKELGTSGRSEQ